MYFFFEKKVDTRKKEHNKKNKKTMSKNENLTETNELVLSNN